MISILPLVSALPRGKQKTADAGQGTIMSPKKLVTRENENPDPVEKQWDPGFVLSLSANFTVVTAPRAAHSLKFENDIDAISGTAGHRCHSYSIMGLCYSLYMVVAHVSKELYIYPKNREYRVIKKPEEHESHMNTLRPSGKRISACTPSGRKTSAFNSPAVFFR